MLQRRCQCNLTTSADRSVEADRCVRNGRVHRVRSEADFLEAFGADGHEACYLACYLSKTTREPLFAGHADMNRTRLLTAALAAASLGALLPCSAHADDAPGPCASLKRIVAAAPGGLASLTPDDGKGVAQPYGDDALCSASHASYQCMWTPRHDAGSNADALQAVAADIASCLPEATHDQNSPGRQHFYVGAPGKRTEITLLPASSNKLRLVISAK
jgi:hypothetical protein